VFTAGFPFHFMLLYPFHMEGHSFLKKSCFLSSYQKSPGGHSGGIVPPSFLKQIGRVSFMRAPVVQLDRLSRMQFCGVHPA